MAGVPVLAFLWLTQNPAGSSRQWIQSSTACGSRQGAISLCSRETMTVLAGRFCRAGAVLGMTDAG